MRNSSLVECIGAENLTGLKSIPKLGNVRNYQAIYRTATRFRLRSKWKIVHKDKSGVYGLIIVCIGRGAFYYREKYDRKDMWTR